MSKNKIGKYIISHEQLASKRATSKVDTMETIFEVVSGQVSSIWDKGDKMFAEMIWQRTVNLLENTSMCALFYEKILISEADKNRKYRTPVFSSLIALFVFGKKLHVYLDQSDDHRVCRLKIIRIKWHVPVFHLSRD